MAYNAEEISNNPLLNRFFLTGQDKASKEKGKAIVKAFYTQQINNDTSLNFFKKRNARWIELLLWAKGSQPMQEFLGYMNISDANKAYVNIDTTQSRIASQFIGTVIQSMAKNKLYPRVDAIDDGSVTEKENRLFDALFRMHDKDTVLAVQEQAGVNLEPPNSYVPDDEISAKVYYELEDRLPKEIRFEKMLQCVMDDIRFDDIANRKTLSDISILNAAFTKIERISPKKYGVRKCIPTNMVYNFFMNDSGEYEITQIGEFYNVKVKDYRIKFGKSEENPDGLTEQEIFELAKLSSMRNIGMFSYTWNDNWALINFNQQRPYDDCSILVLDCSINCGEDMYFVSKKDSFGKEDIQEKKSVPYEQTKKDGTKINQPKPDNVEIIKRQKSSWMRGIYAPYGDKMLYWGAEDLIIPQYTDVYNPLCPYSVVIPNNDGDYVPSLFERIMEPLREYQLAKLKRKQIISLLERDGYRIDVESARNIDLGNGDSFDWMELVRIKNQTGVELWSSKGVDPLQPAAPPISAGTQSTDLQKVIGLTQVLESIRAEIRELIGVPPYRDGSDVGDRTSGVLQEQQSSASFNVTDFVLSSDNQLWQETFYKLCLLHWNDIVKEEPESEEDLLNTRFKISVKMKMTDYEKGLIEQDIQRYSQVVDAYGNPALTPADAMMIRNIDNFKLAHWYLVKTMEQNRKKSMEDAAKQQQQNALVQQQSNQQTAENEAKLQQQKLDSEKQLIQYKTTQEKELALLNGVLSIAGKGIAIPEEWKPVIQLLVPNIAIPIAMENKQMNQIIQQQQQQQMQPQGDEQEAVHNQQEEQQEPQMQQ